MKTAVTVIQTIQTGMDNYKDLKKTKVFEDNATLLEIKQWAKEAMNVKKVEVEDISLGCLDFLMWVLNGTQCRCNMKRLQP